MWRRSAAKETGSEAADTKYVILIYSLLLTGAPCQQKPGAQIRLPDSVWEELPVCQSHGDYLAIVSYAADGNTINGQYLDRVRLGDTCVTGLVALDATVAHDATVAKDATVAHVTDLQTINPSTSSVVLAIQSAVNALPASLASQASMELLTSLLTDVHDAQLGTWSVDKTQNPKVMTLYRLDGSVLTTFQVTEDSNSAARTVIAG